MSGIWMDHSTARIMEFNTEVVETTVITSDWNHEEKVSSMVKSESLSHNKQQHMQFDYFKKIGEAILKYDHVLLFGPSGANVELANFLKSDSHFAAVKIDVEKTDAMTENQQHAFVRNHFSVSI